MGYMAVFHSALAAVRAAKGAEPRTHTGLRSVFGELAVKNALLGSELGSFLAKAYESKDIADYQTEYEVDRQSAEVVVAGATDFLARIKIFLRDRATDR